MNTLTTLDAPTTDAERHICVELETPANRILQAIVIQQMRLGVLLNKEKLSADQEQALNEYSGRLDGLIYAFKIACPNWSELLEVVGIPIGIPTGDVNRRMERMISDIEEIKEFAGYAVLFRLEFGDQRA